MSAESSRAEAVASFDTAQLGDNPDVLVVMAAYNEEDAIGAALAELPAKVGDAHVRALVVVDGGSDATEDIARSHGAAVVVHGDNMGQGAALRTGFDIATKTGARAIVTMDADGQHSPDELPSLVEPVLTGVADYAQGSRYLGTYDEAGSVRDRGIRLFSWLISILARTRITDCTNGFRAIDADLVRALRLSENRFSAPEILLEVAGSRGRILEVPCHVRSRTAGASKKPGGVRYPVSFLAVMVRVWMRNLRRNRRG